MTEDIRIPARRKVLYLGVLMALLLLVCEGGLRARAWIRYGLPVVDERMMIPPDAEHFTDCMHLADKGNAVMADRFYQHLRRLVPSAL